MSKNVIEQYKVEGNGYHPFLIREGWQVAQLNYMPEQHIDNIKKLDVHFLTDEVFILLKGEAVLIGAEIEDENVVFETELLKPNITYNIPANAWHNIAMREGSEIIIVEKSETHVSDFEFYQLNDAQVTELKQMVSACFDNKKKN